MSLIDTDIDLSALDWKGERPAPTMTRPERSRFWWFWWAFGHVFFLPLRRAWATYSSFRYRETGGWRRRWESFDRACNWLWGHGGCPRWLRPMRRFFYWLFVADFHCRHCGFEDYDDEYTVYDGPDDEDGRTIELLELVHSEVSYYEREWSGQGWRWCYRCGVVDWVYL